LSGVHDDLHEKLGRELDLNKIEEEMRRDKGYGVQSKRKKLATSDVSS